MKNNRKSSRTGVLGVNLNTEMRQQLASLAHVTGWSILETASCAGAVAAPHVDVVLTDAILPDGTWRDLVGHTQGAPVVVVDRIADDNLWTEALTAGAFDMLPNSANAIELQRVLTLAITGSRQTATASGA